MKFQAYVTITERYCVEVEADNFDEAQEKMEDFYKWEEASSIDDRPQVVDVEELRRIE